MTSPREVKSVSKLIVTSPEVPPPLRFVPATTEVMSPVAEATALPLKNRLPLCTYKLLAALSESGAELKLVKVIRPSFLIIVSFCEFPALDG